MQIYNSTTQQFDTVDFSELNKRDEIIFVLDTTKYPLSLLQGMITAICSQSQNFSYALYIKENKIYLKNTYNHYRSNFIHAFIMFIAGYEFSLGWAK